MKPHMLFFILLAIAHCANLPAVVSTKEFFAAIRNGQKNDVFTWLSDNQVNVNASGEYCRKPLHVTAEIGSLELTQMLCDNGAAIAAIDFRRRQPLCLAAIHERLAVVAYLLLKGADPLAVDIVDHTARNIMEQRLASGHCRDEQTCKAIITLLATAEHNRTTS